MIREFNFVCLQQWFGDLKYWMTLYIELWDQ